MKAYCFFSVHEFLFRQVAERIQPLGVELSGFVWAKHQEDAIKGRGATYDPLLVFTRDILPKCDDGQPADMAWLARRERELGISIQRMLAAERHLLAGRSHEQLMRMAEVALREIGDAYDRIKPDFAFSEDVACFFSYVHWALARERGFPYWCIGGVRLPYRITVYTEAPQHWDGVVHAYNAIRARGLSDAERREAEEYVTKFVQRPTRPTGMETRAKQVRIEKTDVSRFTQAVSRYFSDPHDPTMRNPARIAYGRIQRMARVRIADAMHIFDRPVSGERYVLYPIHFQPEASTLVQAPLYLDQVALLEEIAKSLPIDHRLYVKEHLSNRGRRPLGFYNAIKAIPSVRLLGPDEDTFALIRSASVIAVITGTVGWEGLMFGKPVVAFGDAFFDRLPHVYRARDVPKDGWYELFRRAATEHREDRDALLAWVSAMHQGSYPGFIANPNTFPYVQDLDNIENVTNALIERAGIKRASAAGGAHGRRATSTKQAE